MNRQNMDASSEKNIHAKIRKDFGIFKDTVDYAAASILCWSKTIYEEQTEVLEAFLSLRSHGCVPASITAEDLKDWLIEDSRNTLRARFQKEINERHNSHIHLAWEVNMQLKLHDICRAMPANIEEAALVDENVLSAMKSAVSQNSPRVSCLFTTAQVVVVQALKELEAVARPPARPPHSLSAVVGDIVSSLLVAVMDPTNQAATSRGLSEVAVGVAICVFDDLRSAGWVDKQDVGVRSWREVRGNTIAALQRDLLEQAGSPGALQAALRANSAPVSTAIAKSITALLTAADSAENADTAMAEEEQCQTAADPAAALPEYSLTVPPCDSDGSNSSGMSDESDPSNTEAKTHQEIPPAASEVEGDIDIQEPSPLLRAASEEEIYSLEALFKEEETQDDCDVDGEAVGTAAGPQALPHMVKKQKRVRRFFTRVWRALKGCFCCCAPPNTD